MGNLEKVNGVTITVRDILHKLDVALGIKNITQLCSTYADIIKSFSCDFVSSIDANYFEHRVARLDSQCGGHGIEPHFFGSRKTCSFRLCWNFNDDQTRAALFGHLEGLSWLAETRC